MALKNALRFLGYSGGAVPDLHRIPCFVGGQNRLADHQRTLTAGNVTPPKPFVKRRTNCKDEGPYRAALSGFVRELRKSAEGAEGRPRNEARPRGCPHSEVVGHRRRRMLSRSLPQRGYIPQPRVGRASGLPWVMPPMDGAYADSVT